MKKYSYEYINTLAFIYAVSYEKEKRKEIHAKMTTNKNNKNTKKSQS